MGICRSIYPFTSWKLIPNHIGQPCNGKNRRNCGLEHDISDYKSKERCPGFDLRLSKAKGPIVYYVPSGGGGFGGGGGGRGYNFKTSSFLGGKFFSGKKHEGGQIL